MLQSVYFRPLVDLLRKQDLCKGTVPLVIILQECRVESVVARV